MVPGRPRPAVLLGMAAALLLLPPAARGQDVPPAPVGEPQFGPGAGPAPDPAADLEALPDLGVDWPDPERIDSAPTADQSAAAGTTAPPPRAPAERLRRYDVAIEGDLDLGEAFQTRFDQLSALQTNQDKPANAAQIDRRAREDEMLLGDLLRAEGYYDGRATSSVRQSDNETEVRLAIEPGERYTFVEVTLPGLEATGAEAKALREQFAVRPDDPVVADVVQGAVTAFRTVLGREGYPFAKVAEPEITIDHAARRATLALAVDPGTKARFGRIVPTGPRPIFSASHLGEIARFSPGAEYDSTLLEDFRRALIATGLVSSATVTPVATSDPGVVDIAVQIERAPPRTVAGEIGYSTGQGARAEVSWQHRNLIKPEGAVTFRGVGGTNEQSLGATLRKSNASARDRILTAQIVASHTNFNAYDARTFTVGGSLERQTNIIWQKKWTWSAGAELVASDERDTIIATGQGRRRTFFVGALPGSLGYDGSDDLLNPTRGFRLSARISPEASLQGAADFYVKAQIDGSVYQPVTDRVVLAGRLRFGSIAGAQRDDIAPSRRLYSGGGGSVRGYGYQKIGPVDVNGDAVGGRGLTEFGLEARVRIGAFGVVPFLDGGNLYRGSLPKFSGLRYGTGLGVRYYSSFGPIRVDVGTPLNRRPGEARVAVYVSLGQAF